jgi:hypothetical protein
MIVMLGEDAGETPALLIKKRLAAILALKKSFSEASHGHLK